MYENIPEELREYNQFVCWRLEDRGGPKPTKIPYNPKNGMLADVTNPNTWSSFDDAVMSAKASMFDGQNGGIGFVLTKDDPFAFIDLDDCKGDAEAIARQMAIFEHFDSYSECSPSGKGLHIIVKGELPQGRRRSFVEIYSSERYMTMTGNTFKGGPINERQELLSTLFEEMGGGVDKPIYDANCPQKEEDDAIIKRALNAVNGEKFNTLLTGDWEYYYQSQSEADFAFVDIISFYTQNREQIARIFRASALGQRDKAKRDDYVKYMIDKSFDRQIPQINFDALRLKAEVALNTPPEPEPEMIKVDSSVYSRPPGLIGEIADFIFAASPRPVYEFSLAAAIGLLAGVCGKAYNISGTGLNQYILALGMTGVGKEAMASGIDKIVNTVRFQVPSAIDFVGPAEIASGQALLRYLSSYSVSFMSIVGEFGIRLQQLSSPNASTSELALRRVLLDLFNKSGEGKMLRPSIYADKDKNTESIHSPAFSMLGESTPETFFNCIDETTIADGLLPRFTIIEYDGKRPKLNKGHLSAKVPSSLSERFGGLVTNAIQLNENNAVVHVTQTPEASEFLEWVDETADAKINGANQEVIRQLWNRAHIKTLKLAALVAVGDNPYKPVINIDCAKWAYGIIESDIKRLESRFEKGSIGTNNEEIKQVETMVKVMREYLKADYRDLASYKVPQRLHLDKVIPSSYLNLKLRGMAAFRKDRLGGTNAIKRTLATLLENGDIVECGKREMDEKYGFRGRCFMVQNLALISGK